MNLTCKLALRNIFGYGMSQSCQIFMLIFVLLLFFPSIASNLRRIFSYNKTAFYIFILYIYITDRWLNLYQPPSAPLTKFFALFQHFYPNKTLKTRKKGIIWNIFDFTRRTMLFIPDITIIFIIYQDTYNKLFKNIQFS